MSRGRARTVKRMELGGMELGAEIETDDAHVAAAEKSLPRPRPFFVRVPLWYLIRTYAPFLNRKTEMV